MRERTLVDLLLVVVVAVLAYVETFGWSDPAAGLAAILGLFSELDLGVYLVVAGVIGILFVGYVAIYLPKQLASDSSLRES